VERGFSGDIGGLEWMGRNLGEDGVRRGFIGEVFLVMGRESFQRRDFKEFGLRIRCFSVMYCNRSAILVCSTCFLWS
jgi:hypothetical protein